MNPENWEGNALGYSTVETLLEDVSRQMATSNLTRYSRGSGGQKGGGSMRVVKPNSTSNSPRGSIGLGRRRTVMDGLYRRRIPMADQNTVTSEAFNSNEAPHIPTRSNRPVSWHPSSHLAPQPICYSAPPVPASNEFRIFDLPQTPAVYSGYTSPASTFSPLSMPFTGYNQQQMPYSDVTTTYPSNPSYAISQASSFAQQSQSYETPAAENMDQSMYSHFDWSNFATNGFETSTTAPPTPENFLPIQRPDPTFPAEESIPYHPLSDTESEGEEILVGMGLYDSPEVTKTPASDPQLDNYRTLMMSQLLGPAYRQTEPTGKGLKLEETWNPPVSDDEEDDDDDDEQDGEGDDDDDDEPTMTEPNNNGEHATSVQTAQSDSTMEGSQLLNLGNFLPDAVQSKFSTHDYDRNGWL